MNRNFYYRSVILPEGVYADTEEVIFIRINLSRIRNKNEEMRCANSCSKSI